jgi:hypothetical protein
LVDNVLLGRTFREKFADGFRRLVRRGKLRLEGEWAKLLDPTELEAWLTEVTQSDWNVFIEGPPNGKSDPAYVLKYLARYLTGGPISDRRIIRDQNDRVSFWARSKNKAAGNRPREFELPGKEFVRRWSMHILPKGYTRSRCCGGFHGSKRKSYLSRCRELLTMAGPTSADPEAAASPEAIERPERMQTTVPNCPRCEIAMCCIQKHPRPSWKEVFKRGIYADAAIYSPMNHSRYKGLPAFPYQPDG